LGMPETVFSVHDKIIKQKYSLLYKGNTSALLSKIQKNTSVQKTFHLHGMILIPLSE
jgi:hypothetical protein